MKIPNCLKILVAVALSGAAHAATVAYWEFDDLTGTDSVGSYDLGYVSGVQTTIIAPNPVPNPDAGTSAANPNAVGSSPVFQRTTADTTFNMSGSASFTFEGWFQTGDVGDSGITGVIGGNRRGASPTAIRYTGWVVWMRDDGLVEFLIQDSPTTNDSIITTTQYDNGSSHHFAAVWDHDNGANGTYSLYLDGSLIGSKAGAGALNEGDTNFTIGRRANDNLNPWTGELDEMRFSNEALTPSQFLNVPEPSSSLIVLGTLGCAALLRRRK